MKRLTLNIDESKYKAFLSFKKTLDYVIVQEDEAVLELQKEEVLKRLDLIDKGEMKTRSWDDAKSELFNK